MCARSGTVMALQNVSMRNCNLREKILSTSCLNPKMVLLIVSGCQTLVVLGRLVKDHNWFTEPFMVPWTCFGLLHATLPRTIGIWQKPLTVHRTILNQPRPSVNTTPLLIKFVLFTLFAIFVNLGEKIDLGKTGLGKMVWEKPFLGKKGFEKTDSGKSIFGWCLLQEALFSKNASGKSISLKCFENVWKNLRTVDPRIETKNHGARIQLKKDRPENQAKSFKKSIQNSKQQPKNGTARFSAPPRF